MWKRIKKKKKKKKPDRLTRRKTTECFSFKDGVGTSCIAPQNKETTVSAVPQVGHD